MADVVEWRAAAGGQLETEGHGLVDAGVRKGDLAAVLYTETLDLRWSPTWAHGRGEIGVRAGAFAGDMWITPWSHGAPDHARMQRVATVGPDARWQRWLGGGWFVEAAGAARFAGYTPLEGATLAVDDMVQLRGDVALGTWLDAASWRLTGGIDRVFSATPRTAPHATLDATVAPSWQVRPLGELHAGIADDRDDRIATRLGGMVPYTVPLAGAAWAEFWVEDYVAVRSGIEVAPGSFRFAGLLDTAVWTYPAATSLAAPEPRNGAVGLAGRIAWEREPARVEVAVAGSPTLVRATGVSPVSVFLLASTGWRRTQRDIHRSD
jgi:hypothetical protein